MLFQPLRLGVDIVHFESRERDALFEHCFLKGSPRGIGVGDWGSEAAGGLQGGQS
jgi:hypothetical protein